MVRRGYKRRKREIQTIAPTVAAMEEAAIPLLHIVDAYCQSDAGVVALSTIQRETPDMGYYLVRCTLEWLIATGRLIETQPANPGWTTKRVRRATPLETLAAQAGKDGPGGGVAE